MRFFTLADLQHLVLAFFLGLVGAIVVYLAFRYGVDEREEEPLDDEGGEGYFAEGEAFRNQEGEAFRNQEGEAFRNQEGEAFRNQEGEAFRNQEGEAFSNQPIPPVLLFVFMGVILSILFYVVFAFMRGPI